MLDPTSCDAVLASAAEAKKNGGDGKVKPLDIPAGERGLKGHITVDGLRYDDAGRLWVLTQRGDETKSVLDVFSPAGAFLGEVTVPMRVSGFNLGGSSLVTAGENDVGIPVVTVWAIK
jgi:sugar lactone lactonase YvrE